MPKPQFFLAVSASAVVQMGVLGAAWADQVIPDDLIVQSSLCVGVDCVNNETFGFHTVILKENNLRIFFNDTSNSASFPTNDWQITINDSANGGNSFFAIEDVTAGETLFRLCAVADATCTPILPVMPDPQVAVNTGDIATLNTTVGGNTADILANSNGISANDSAIGTLQTTVSGNTTRIDTLEGTVSGHTTQIRNLQTTVGQHTTQIGALQTTVTSNTGRISTLEDTSVQHAAAISGLQTTATNHERRIGSLENRMDNFSADLGSVKTGVAVAIALGGGVPLQADQNGSIAFNLGNFAGRSAFGVVGAVRLDGNTTLNLGLASGFSRDTIGGRVGVQYTW